MPISPRLLRSIALLLLTFAVAQVCFAHAILLKSTPTAKSTVAAGVLPIELTFNSRIDGGRSHISLTAADGRERTLSAIQQPRPQTLTATSAPLTPGAYTLHWVVLANDGHITKGDVAFNVR